MLTVTMLKSVAKDAGYRTGKTVLTREWTGSTMTKPCWSIRARYR